MSKKEKRKMENQESLVNQDLLILAAIVALPVGIYLCKKYLLKQHRSNRDNSVTNILMSVQAVEVFNAIEKVWEKHKEQAILLQITARLTDVDVSLALIKRITEKYPETFTRVKIDWAALIRQYGLELLNEQIRKYLKIHQLDLIYLLDKDYEPMDQFEQALSLFAKEEANRIIEEFKAKQS